MKRYKVHFLTSVSTISRIVVFYGPHTDNVNALFGSDPENVLFSDIFNKEELANIQKMKIPVTFSTQYIHEDDTIGVTKTKIAHEDDYAFSIDEMYMFGMNREALNATLIYNILTKNNKIQITYDRLYNFLMNIVRTKNGELAEFSLPNNLRLKGTDVFTYNDILDLKLDDTFCVSKPLGQRYFLQEGEYPPVYNPYELAKYDNVTERYIRRSIGTMNNNLVLTGGNIVDNNIYVCLAGDVLPLSDTNMTIHLYYPLLYNKEIQTLDVLESERYKLIDATRKTYNKGMFDKVDLFYDIYQKNKPPAFSSRGVKSITLVVRQVYSMNIPTNIIFKVLHSTKDAPVVKYNPGMRQENMLRLFCDKTTTEGEKIPYLQKSKTLSLLRYVLLTKNKAISIYFNDINAHCEFDENADISISMTFESAVDEKHIDDCIREKINPVLETIQRYLEQHGYRIQIFDRVQSPNTEIKMIDYETIIPIKKPIALAKIIGCVSSAFVVESDDISKDIVMRFKRVSNFNKMTSMEAFIIEKQKEGLRDINIVNKLLENYTDLTADDAINLVGKVASEMQIERGVRKNVIDVKSNPGFKTTLRLNAITSDVTITMNNINDRRFLDIIPVYLDSLIQLTQTPQSLGIDRKKITKLCSAAAADVTYEDVVPLEDTSYSEKKTARDDDTDQLSGVEPQVQEPVMDDLGSKEKINNALDLFFGNDDEEEEEEEEEEGQEINGGDAQEIVGGDGSDENEDENVVRNIEGMKLHNPYLFQQRIQDRDPVLILLDKQGKYNSYSRTCHQNVRRQPVILSQKELDKINKDHPNFLDEKRDIIKYGSKPDNQYYYICPRYWDLNKNTIVTPEEIKENGLEDKIIPLDAQSVPKGKYIYEFNHPNEYDENRKLYPGFIVDRHPDGHCLPCCFAKWNVPSMIARKKQCSGEANAKKDTHVLEKDEYIKGPGKFPLSENRWGYLPTGIQNMLNYKQTKCVPDKVCLLRHGVELNKMQSFVACIADAICYTKKPVISVAEMKRVIVSMLTIDNFITFQNGNLVTEFYHATRTINADQPKYRESKLFAKTRGDEHKQRFFTKACSALERFIEFLSDDGATIDYTYLWDILCTPHPSLFENGVNLVILEVPTNDITDNVNIICPTNHYTSKMYNPTKPTLILYHQDEYYEPIYRYRTTRNQTTGQDILSVGRLFKESDANAVPEVKFIFETIIKPYYDKMCKPMASMPTTYKAKHPILLDLLIDICSENRYGIETQILNYQGKVIGLVVRPPLLGKSGFIPCYPSSLQEAYNYEFMLEPTIWRNYRETIDFLSFVRKDAGAVIPCSPVFKVIEDEVIVGVITETNQFIQLSVPEPVSNVNDHLRDLRNSNYITNKDTAPLVASDSVVTGTDKVDTERVEYVKKIKLESSFYQAFRNTIRTLLNDPQYIDQRNKLESGIRQMTATYTDKLGTINKELADLVGDLVLFVKDYNYNLINEIHTCVVTKDADKCSADSPMCSVTSNGKCQMIVPKKNLLNGSDNETNYFLRMSDELIRYKRIQQFMFEPQVYMSFGAVDYSVDDDEVIVMQSMLNAEFFDKLVGKNINNYVASTSYDNVNPRISQTYSNAIKI